MKKSLTLGNTKLFDPSVKRNENFFSDEAFSDFDFKSDNDLLFESKRGTSRSGQSSKTSKFGKIYSTRELNIDFSKFENHTFFDSAVSKTNIAFDRVINKFPFDQSKSDIEDFKNDGTGYENYVYDQFPKNKGFIHFISASNQHIAIKDLSGYLYSTDNEKKTNNPVFSPHKRGFTTEFWLRVPEESNQESIVCQLIDTSRAGFSISLSGSSNSATNCNLSFTVISGSNAETITTSLKKGEFKFISAVYDNNKKNSQIYIDSQLKVTSSFRDFDNLEMKLSDFLIGSGSSYTDDDVNGTTFLPLTTLSGAIDEFRYYHGAKGITQIQDTQYTSTFLDAEDNLDLILYMKFNEPAGSYTGNSIVLDYSGNSLHSQITNFSAAMRNSGSVDTIPMKKEKLSDCPVLFADNSNVKSLNTNLLTSASLYDEFNPNLITKLVPVHYFLEGQQEEGFSNLTGSLGNAYVGGNLPNTGKIGSGQLLMSFLLIWAKFFDEIKISIDAMADILHVSYDDFEGSSPNFYKLIAENRGIRLPNIIDSNISFDKFQDGININNTGTTSVYSLNDFQNEIWKRILINIRHIYKEKGTRRSFQSLFNTLGIDFDKYFSLKEYGGSRYHYLSDLRKEDKKVIKFIDLSGSLVTRSDADKADIDAQGLSKGTSGINSAPYLISPFLSSSRIETGFPDIDGTYVQKNIFPPHGISNAVSDGLLTSGSFTYEGIYKFVGSHHVTQSLVRLHVTGTAAPSSTSGGILTNLIAINDGNNSKIKLYVKPHVSSVENDFLEMQITSASLFDGNPWYVSFGKIRNDDNIFYNSVDIKNTPSSSFFLRCGRLDSGRKNVYFATSSFYNEKSRKNNQTNYFNSIGATLNASGAYALIGSQSITESPRFLNSDQVKSEARYTDFSGQISGIRFYSKAITEKGFKERINNPFSLSVEDPIRNYNHTTKLTGSFGKLRLDNTVTRQITTSSNASGEISIFDNSQNNFNFTGKMFEASKRILKTDQIKFTRVSYDFDQRISDDKVRVRSYELQKNLENSIYSVKAPLYEIPEKDKNDSDKRISIDLSAVKALNEDIVKMFENLEVFDEYLGDPRDAFEDSYIDLEKAREVYFNDLLQKLDLEAHTKFFTWFDNSFTDLLLSLVPLETVFLGVNYVIEPHILERNKIRYNYNHQYLINSRNISDDNQFG